VVLFAEVRTVHAGVVLYFVALAVISHTNYLHLLFDLYLAYRIWRFPGLVWYLRRWSGGGCLLLDHGQAESSGGNAVVDENGVETVLWQRHELAGTTGEYARLSPLHVGGSDRAVLPARVNGPVYHLGQAKDATGKTIFGSCGGYPQWPFPVRTYPPVLTLSMPLVGDLLLSCTNPDLS
jgi:hypothetical protein